VGTGLTRSDIPQGPLKPAAATLARSLLRRLGVLRLHGRRFLTLSYGERRLVLVARALAQRPALLLLDEGLNGLDATNRLRLLRFLDGSRRSRLPWVLSTHRAEDVPQAATHLVEMAAGRVLQARPIARADRRAPARATLPAAPAPKRQAELLRKAQPLVTVEAADVYVDHAPVLRGIDLTVRQGDCWVVHGGNGAGKSTLLRLLYGDLHPATGGRIRRAGQGPGVPIATFRDHTGFISPQLQTDHPQYLSALEVAASGLHSSIGLNDVLTAGERRRAAVALAGVGLEGFGARPLRELSYGQLRRVLFARALIRRPRLLLLDEPYAGLDPGTRADLLSLIDARIAAGTTVVIATHHRDEWPAATTHELALRRGRIVQPRGSAR
jgi:molybdate transport system ATP-binding protein